MVGVKIHHTRLQKDSVFRCLEYLDDGRLMSYEFVAPDDGNFEVVIQKDNGDCRVRCYYQGYQSTMEIKGKDTSRNTGVNSWGYIPPVGGTYQIKASVNPANIRSQLNGTRFETIWFDEAPGSWEDEITKVKKPKCECGTTITLGSGDDPQFHSDYCPVYRKPE